MTTPEPGWYPDPTAPDRLRLWDGEGWTDQSRPWDPSPPAPPAEPVESLFARLPVRPAEPLTPGEPVPAERRNAVPDARSRRRRMVVEGAGLGIALLVTGSSIMPSWGSTAPGAARPAYDPKLAAATASPSPAQPAPPVDCRLAASRPSPARVVAWLHEQGMAVSLTTGGAVPAGACAVASFTDPNAPTPNLIAAYPTPESAGTAAAAPAPHGGPRIRFAGGIYVMILDPALSGLRVQYQAMLDAYVVQTNPAVVTPSSTSTTAPVSTTRRTSSSRK